MLLTSILSHFSFSIDNFQYFAQLQGFLLCISWQQLGQGGVCFPSVRAGIAKDFGPSVLHRTDDVSAWHQWQWKGAAVHRPSCLFWVVLSGLPVQAALVQNLVLG